MLISGCTIRRTRQCSGTLAARRNHRRADHREIEARQAAQFAARDRRLPGSGRRRPVAELNAAPSLAVERGRAEVKSGSSNRIPVLELQAPIVSRSGSALPSKTRYYRTRRACREPRGGRMHRSGITCLFAIFLASSLLCAQEDIPAGGRGGGRGGEATPGTSWGLARLPMPPPPAEKSCTLPIALSATAKRHAAPKGQTWCARHRAARREGRTDGPPLSQGVPR